MMRASRIPLLTKYACLYSRKGRSRFLDMHRVYVDGTIDDYPFASINLDDPIVLLDPKHPSASSLRPHMLARACELFTDEHCYRILRLAEDEILRTRNFDPSFPVFFAVADLDQSHAPNKIIGLEYYEALKLLGERTEAGFVRPAPADPMSPSLRAIFGTHAADSRPMRTPILPAKVENAQKCRQSRFQSVQTLETVSGQQSLRDGSSGRF